MNWMTHIMTAVILYSSAMGVGLLHGHPHQHEGGGHVYTAAHVHGVTEKHSAAKSHGGAHAHDVSRHADLLTEHHTDGPADDAPCSRADCDRHACCSVHSHHLIAIGHAIPFEPACDASDFRALENPIVLADYPSDIFHPPKSC